MVAVVVVVVVVEMGGWGIWWKKQFVGRQRVLIWTVNTRPLITDPVSFLCVL